MNNDNQNLEQKLTDQLNLIKWKQSYSQQQFEIYKTFMGPVEAMKQALKDIGELK